MTDYTSKFSPTEKKALELALRYHRGQKRRGGAHYIDHPVDVANLLFQYGFRGKYVFTALCHDLLEDTDVTDQEIKDTCGRFTLEAVRLLTKKRKNEPDKEVDMDAYLAAIQQNDVAYQVKVADRTMNLWSSMDAGIPFRKRYLAETKKYYLDFAKDSPMFKELKLAYETVSHNTELEKQSYIPVDIEEIEDLNPDSDYVAVQLFSREGDMVPFTCMIQRKDIERIQKRKKKLIPKLTVTAFPDDEVRRYASEEDFENNKDEKGPFPVASQSILFREAENLDHHALVTGIVRGIRGEFSTMTGLKIAVFLELLGNMITLVLDEEDFEDLKPGEVLSGILSLYGDLS